MAAMDEISLALVGIGSLEPSSLLQSSGNIFSGDELKVLGSEAPWGTSACGSSTPKALRSLRRSTAA
jgi:DNA-binding transcriptional regulator LsrR (DeoR family)